MHNFHRVWMSQQYFSYLLHLEKESVKQSLWDFWNGINSRTHRQGNILLFFHKVQYAWQTCSDLVVLITTPALSTTAKPSLSENIGTEGCLDSGKKLGFIRVSSFCLKYRYSTLGPEEKVFSSPNSKIADRIPKCLVIFVTDDITNKFWTFKIQKSSSMVRQAI